MTVDDMAKIFNDLVSQGLGHFRIDGVKYFNVDDVKQHRQGMEVSIPHLEETKEDLINSVVESYGNYIKEAVGDFEYES